MTSRDIEQIKQGFVERLVDELNPKTEHERKTIETRYYKEVGTMMETATIGRYVPLIAYRNVRKFFSRNGNNNGREH